MVMMKFCCGVVVVMLLMGASVDAALLVKNDLKHGDLILMRLPGCCNYCTAEICPTICEEYRDVVVKNGKEVTLEERVGPYPLDSLHVQVKGGDIYCVAQNDLLHLTTTALLKIGPGTGCPSISARIVDKIVEGPQDSGQHDICLIRCKSHSDFCNKLFSKPLGDEQASV